MLVVAALWLGGCGDSSGAHTLRLGYFPNVTHATALVGLERGTFAAAARSVGYELAPSAFNAGPSAVEALLSGALDATYIGPNPTINAHVKSRGQAVRVVAGATSGGAFLVVRAGIETPTDLRGKTLASPQLGGTQDVALRTWLKAQGFATDLQGGGDVSIQPQENAQILEAFRDDRIDGAWVPEPWATRLVSEGSGHVLVDERDLWPNRSFVTTHLVVRTALLQEHAALVDALVRAHAETTKWVAEHPDEAQALAIDAIADATGKRIGADVVAKAWTNLSFTTDPLSPTLRRSAEDAEGLGLLSTEGVDLDALYDLGPLERARAELGGVP